MSCNSSPTRLSNLEPQPSPVSYLDPRPALLRAGGSRRRSWGQDRFSIPRGDPSFLLNSAFHNLPGGNEVVPCLCPRVWAQDLWGGFKRNKTGLALDWESFVGCESLCWFGWVAHYFEESVTQGKTHKSKGQKSQWERRVRGEAKGTGQQTAATYPNANLTITIK